MARATKLTPDVHERLVEAVRLGVTQELACNYAGIDPTSLFAWKKKAQKGIQPYLDLIIALKEAEGKALVGWMAKIERAANDGNWQAAAWKAERRYPQAYGRTAIDIRHKINPEDIKKLSDDELESIIQSEG